MHLRCFENNVELCGKQKPCHVRLFDCEFIRSHAEACLSTKANRKYDWVAHEYGPILGNKNPCPNKNEVHFKIYTFLICNNFQFLLIIIQKKSSGNGSAELKEVQLSTRKSTSIIWTKKKRKMEEETCDDFVCILHCNLNNDSLTLYLK